MGGACCVEKLKGNTFIHHTFAQKRFSKGQGKNRQKSQFYYIYYIKCVYKGLIFKMLETTFLPTTLGQKFLVF